MASRSVDERNAVAAKVRAALRRDGILDTVIDSLPGIFFMIDERGRFQHWNANLESVTGYSAEELQAMSPLDLFAPDLHGEVSKALNMALEHGKASLEAPLRTRFGKTRPHNYYGKRVVIAGVRFIAGMGLDVTRLKQAQQDRERQEQQLRHLATHVPGVIYQLHQDIRTGQVRMPYASAKLFDVFGVRAEAVRTDASSLFERVSPNDADRVMRAMTLSAENLSVFREQFRMCPPGGEDDHAEWVEVESTPERLEDGSTLWHGFARRVTERKRMEEELSRLAYTDSLTGLPNRALLQLSLDERIAEASLVGHGLGLLHLDLDHFKDINDVWGHGTGDRLLVKLSERLETSIGQDALIGRIGGDDFLIIVEGPEAGVVAEQLAAGLCQTLAVPLEVDQRVVRVTGSVGISLFPEDGETTEDLMRHADAALYGAKAQGPGTWARYTPQLTATAMARRYMETELRSAIEDDEIQAALQPVVHLASGQVVGHEALARWHHRDDGWIDPEEFIALAEARGLIMALGEQVYRKAFRYIATGVGGVLAVNVAPAQLRAADFVECLAGLAAEFGLALETIEVEITERVLMSDSGEAIRQIRRLRDYGVRVAIDDFGTGYSSLAYLRKLPIQRLKIDQSFIRDIAQTRENAAIVRAIAALSRDLGLEVTAEGVQTRAEAEFVRDCGCEFGQGWFYGRATVVRSKPASARRSRTVNRPER
jgi:diguanylate cyclase (GGDEF)-like protein/PAS domain S-box-containing protein